MKNVVVMGSSEEVTNDAYSSGAGFPFFFPPKLYGLSWLSNPGPQPDFNLWWCITKNKEGKPGDISETFVLPQLEEVVTWPHRSC